MRPQFFASTKHRLRWLHSVLQGSVASVFLHSLVVAVLVLPVRGCEQVVLTDTPREDLREVGLIQSELSEFRQVNHDAAPMTDTLPSHFRAMDTISGANTVTADNSPDVDGLPLNHNASQHAGSLDVSRVIRPAVVHPDPAQLHQFMTTDGFNVAEGSANLVDNRQRQVYLPDTSNRMFNDRNWDRVVAWMKGRLCLLEPHQRFQVILYGNEPRRMRLRGVEADFYQATVQQIGLVLEQFSKSRGGFWLAGAMESGRWNLLRGQKSA